MPFTELERRLRERGVRVPERLAILARLREDADLTALRLQLTELQERIESTARAVRRALS